jgi:hypothetical protein
MLEGKLVKEKKTFRSQARYRCATRTVMKRIRGGIRTPNLLMSEQQDVEH